MVDNSAKAADVMFKDPESVYAGQLYWPGVNGIPFIGTPPHTDPRATADAEPKIRPYAHVRIFVLSDPEDLSAYEAISQRIAERRAMLSYEERVYDSDIKSWRVLVRWIDLYATTHRSIQEALRSVMDDNSKQRGG